MTGQTNQTNKQDRTQAGNSRRSVLRAGVAVGALGATGVTATAGADPATASALEPSSPESDPSRYDRGLRMLRKVSGEAGLDVIESLREFSPDLARFVVEFTYGDIYPRPGLDLPERQLVTLGALVALGDTGPQLNVHINAALNVGLSPEQIVEALLQCMPYAGFPRVLNAVSVAREVFAERDIDPTAK